MIYLKKILGILVHQIKDPQRYTPLFMLALEAGFQDILVYTPFDVDFKHEMIHGYVYVNGNWEQSLQPFPSITYDIGYYTSSPLIQRTKKIKAHPRLPLVGYGLGNKWTIHKHLTSSKSLKPFLIPTELAQSVTRILAMVQSHTTIMIKPLNGKGGKGIVRLTRTSSGYTLLENDEQREEHVNAEQIRIYLKELLSRGKYLIQKWVDIRDKNGAVYDIRLLMQKNYLGKWQLTGMGVRQGGAEKITSNLTGGGHAFPVQPFLKEQFDEQVAQRLSSKIEKIGWYIPTFLEKSYKKRLVELGLDLAIDRDQHIWIIEVNIKPGKTLMRKLEDFEADQQVLRAPIQYARYLVDRLKNKKLTQK